ETPIFHTSQTSGIATLAFRDTLNGWAFGGDIGDANSHTDNVAATFDGGKTWRLTGRPTMSGAIYGSAYVPGSTPSTIVVVSPKGSEFSRDNGATWTPLDPRPYWAVGFAPNGDGWMVGPGGRITRVQLR